MASASPAPKSAIVALKYEPLFYSHALGLEFGEWEVGFFACCFVLFLLHSKYKKNSSILPPKGFTGLWKLFCFCSEGAVFSFFFKKIFLFNLLFKIYIIITVTLVMKSVKLQMYNSTVKHECIACSYLLSLMSLLMVGSKVIHFTSTIGRFSLRDSLASCSECRSYPPVFVVRSL